MGEESLSIKLGQFIKIENKERKNLESDSYIAIQVEDVNGSNERCLLFTENELSNAKNIDSSNWLASELKAGRLYPLTIGTQKFYMIKIFDLNKTEKIVKITQGLLNKAEKRSEKNPEDLTKKSFIRDLFD